VNNFYFDKLINSIQNSNVDAFLIAPSEELNFLFGFSPYLCERFQGMFIKKTGDYFYYCNILTRDEVEIHISGDKIFTWRDNEGFINNLIKLFNEKKMDGMTIGLNSSCRAYNVLDIAKKGNVNFINGKEIFEKIRAVKTQDEIETIKEAGRRTDLVIEESIKYIRPGMTEKNIITKIEELFIQNDMIPAFAIVSRGSNTAMPHYSGNDGVVQNKDIVLLDIGGKYKSMFSDMTRTVFVGKPTKKEHEIYQIVLEASKIGIENAKVGRNINELDRLSRSYIEKNGYGDCFITRLGHGIGYSVHEAPYITEYNEEKIKNGMAFSIEPGIYLKNRFGIRIEDIVIVEDDKAFPVNHFTKDVIIL